MRVSVPSSEPGHQMSLEIREQPVALQRLLDDGLPQLFAAAARIRERRPRFMLLAARGTSDHAALYAKYLVETLLAVPAGLASLSTLTVYGSRPDLRDVLWIAVSQSGGSPDLVESTLAARSAGALTLAVTNTAASPLSAAAELAVDVLAGPERSVAATKSYTSELLALWLLVDAVAGGGGGAARAIPGVVSELLSSHDINSVSQRYRFVERLVVTGRGFALPTAREAALKLMETSYISAHAFSGADLLHGPLAMVDAGMPVIVVVPQGVGGQAMKPVLDRLHERGANLLVVGDPAAAPHAVDMLPLPAGLDEDLAPIAQIIPLQRLALILALARGHDPDAPRGLFKVTETL